MPASEPTPSISLTVDEEIASNISVGSLVVDSIYCGDRPASLDEELSALEERYRSQWKTPGDALEALKPARRLYHAFGIDPSKTRPSSEALLRRVLKNKDLYRVNAVVDAANLASLSFLLPVGLYDLKKMQPPVILRAGGADESFDGIRKDRVHLRGRPTLVDEVGPFGNPTSDSLRTCITKETDSVWFVIFAPGDYPKAKLDEDLALAEGILRRHATR